MLPEDASSRVASEFQAANFGGETSTANIVVEGADKADKTKKRKRKVKT